MPSEISFKTTLTPNSRKVPGELERRFGSGRKSKRTQGSTKEKRQTIDRKIHHKTYKTRPGGTLFILIDRLESQIPPTTIDIGQAQLHHDTSELTVVLNEIQYGSPEETEFGVRVVLKLISDGIYVLQIQDNVFAPVIEPIYLNVCIC